MTAQTPEEFVYKGKRYLGIYAEPLHQYLQTQNIEFQAFISTCWRGYRGVWVISDNKLYLTCFSGAIRIYATDDDVFSPDRSYETKNISLNYLFPNRQNVFAEWFSGEIRLGKGILKEDFDNCETLYRKEIYMRFKDGVLIEERVVRNNLSFQDRIPSYIKKIYELDNDDDFTFLEKRDILLNKKLGKPLKERVLSLFWVIFLTLIVFPFAILQMMVILVVYIYDSISLKINKSS
ncbi:hypothetical protein GEO21_12830 [Sphingobacterium faecium]|uniref:hypothetical protein n=1 Tax=Sphingobacterium faecium TaxID=34087 RepID=UPI0012926195|nr:hypothetical protein [Sphingobacterium faecium]MQP28393.1 hypothetical protein [Sphingobacterium faecium]